MVVRERRRKTSRRTRYNTRRQNRVRKRQSKRQTNRRRKTNKMNRKRGKRSYKKYSRERIIQEGGMFRSCCGAKSRRTSPESMTEEQRRKQRQDILRLAEAEDRMRYFQSERYWPGKQYGSDTSLASGPPKRNSTQPSVKKSKKSKKKKKTQGDVVRESRQREGVARIQSRMPEDISDLPLTKRRYSQRSTRQSTNANAESTNANAESTNSKSYREIQLGRHARRRLGY